MTELLHKLYPVEGPSEREDVKALFPPMINEDFKILEDSMAYRPVGTPFVLLFFQGGGQVEGN